MNSADSASTSHTTHGRTRKSRAPKVNRRLHRIGSIVAAAPLLVVILTGLLLQLKKDWSWVQPPTVKGSTQDLQLSWDEVIASAASAKEAGIQSWADVDRLDVRPSKGMLKVRGKNRWEVQIDAVTGEVLQTSYRRSDLIEQLHDGSWFAGTWVGDRVKLWVFLPVAVILLCLWITGMYLWLLPHLVKRRRRAS